MTKKEEGKQRQRATRELEIKITGRIHLNQVTIPSAYGGKVG